MPNRTSQTVSVSSCDFHVVSVGEGPPLLLVHGFPLDHSMWESQFGAFAKHRIIAPDLRGFGASKGEIAESLTMQRMADDLVGILDALEVTQPVTLCGLSMGGYVALEFWNRHADRLGALILCDTRAAPDTPETAKGRQMAAHQVLRDGNEVLIEGMVPKLISDETRTERPQVAQRLREMGFAADPQAVAAALRGMAERIDFRDRLAEIGVPTLVICGSDDVITPAREMREMVEAMPNVGYVEITGAGHLAPLEKPPEVNQAIGEFLDGLRS